MAPGGEGHDVVGHERAEPHTGVTEVRAGSIRPGVALGPTHARRRETGPAARYGDRADRHVVDLGVPDTLDDAFDGQAMGAPEDPRERDQTLIAVAFAAERLRDRAAVDVVARIAPGRMPNGEDRRAV